MKIFTILCSKILFIKICEEQCVSISKIDTSANGAIASCQSVLSGPSQIKWAISGLHNDGGPESLSHDSKYGPSLSKAVGPVDPSYLVVKKSHFNKKYMYSSYS